MDILSRWCRMVCVFEALRRLKRGHVMEHVSRPAHPTHVVQPGLAALGITQPSPIQAAAMPRLLAGSNAAIQSYTGSGKVSTLSTARANTTVGVSPETFLLLLQRVPPRAHPFS
jgi:hypothetical protein